VAKASCFQDGSSNGSFCGDTVRAKGPAGNQVWKAQGLAKNDDEEEGEESDGVADGQTVSRLRADDLAHVSNFGHRVRC
jgi:hypothetical protein